MDELSDRDLMRRLAGASGPDERKSFDSRIGADPAAAERLEALREAWDGLADFPSRGLPPGFLTSVMARVREEARAEPSFAALPLWARAVSAGALGVGVALGVALGTLPAAWDSPPTAASAVAVEESADLWSEPGLGESYLRAAESGTDLLAGAGDDEALP